MGTTEKVKRIFMGFKTQKQSHKQSGSFGRACVTNEDSSCSVGRALEMARRARGNGRALAKISQGSSVAFLTGFEGTQRRIVKT